MKYEKKYFIESDISNYKDYRVRVKKFSMVVKDLIEAIPNIFDMKILDFGCATGGHLCEFKNKGINNIKGTDISYWNIEWGRINLDLYRELDYYNVNLLTRSFDLVLFLDVLEHVHTIDEIWMFFQLLTSNLIVVRLPVSKKENEHYVLDISENDPTHIHRHTKEWWEKLFYSHGFTIKKILSGKGIYDSEGVLARIYER